MLVHRDTDEMSDGDQPAEQGRSHLVARNGSSDAAGEAAGEAAAASEQDASRADGGDDSREDGKTHLIGDALKTVYQRTLEEDIPDDFLDLLKQLK